MPWKLGSPDEPTEKIEVRMPASMKRWLQARPETPSKFIRRIVAARMAAEKRKQNSD